MDANTHRFAQFLSRLFDRKGSGPAMSVVDDVMPVVDILSRNVETWCSRGEVPFGICTTVGAIAGQYAQLAVDCPPNMLVRVDRIFFSCAAAGYVYCGITPAALTLATNVNVVMADTRCVAASTLAPAMASQTTAAAHIITPPNGPAGGAIAFGHAPVANTLYELPLPGGIVLAGMDAAALVIESDTVNQQVRFIVQGMYRPDATVGEQT